MSNQFASLWNQYLDQPREVSLETLAYCNAACTFCPYPTLERIGTKMPDELIYRLIDEMAEWKTPFWFSPFKVSEPFLDKRLESICYRFLDLAQLGTLRLFTNGSALTKKNLAWVGGLSRLSSLWVSLNEHRADEYQKLMSLPFDRTANNLDEVHRQVESGEFRQAVVVSRVGRSIDFQKYVNERWPRFQIHIIKKDAWIDFTEPDNSRIPPTPCARWFELNIMANGRTALCCMDSTGEYGTGDITNRSMLEVYNDPAWRERREKLWSRKMVDPCSRCAY